MEVYRNPADTFVAGFLASPPMNLLPGRLDAAGDRLVASAPGFSCDVPAAYRPSFAPYANREVVIGIRPEDLHESRERAGADPAPLDATIETVEALGPETILMLALPGSPIELAARVGVAGGFEAGKPIRLYYDARQIHLFDPATTKRIPRPKAEAAPEQAPPPRSRGRAPS